MSDLVSLPYTALDTQISSSLLDQGRDRRWAAFEVKLGQAALDLAATDLLRLAARIDTEKHGPPAALAVITGWGYAYRRPDGVAVIPVGALGA